MKLHDFKIRRIFNLLPFIFIIFGVVLYFAYGKSVNPKEIFELAPENYFAAIIYLMGMYALKSLSVVFPVAVLYISSGMIFPLYIAIIVNIVGIAVSLSIPYAIGFFSRNKSSNEIIKSYPKLNQISSFRKNNETFFVFIVRIVGIVPMDVVSIYMGSVGIPYKKHLFVSILAMLPDLLAITAIGATITDPTSLRFILSCTFKILISVLSIILYRKYKKGL